MKQNNINLIISGLPSSPKLFSALQLAQGLCAGKWERIGVITSSDRDSRFQHLGDYRVIHVSSDAAPQRYLQAVNIAASCMDVIILSSISNEWQYGIQQHLSASYFEELLRAHRMLFHHLHHAPVHVIVCVDSRVTFLHRDEEGRRKLYQETIVQQPAIERQFTVHLHIDKRGGASVKKDSTKVLPTEGERFKVTAELGTRLLESCKRGESPISRDVQMQIDNCNTLSELYQLLFDLDVEDPAVLSCFTKRKIQLDLECKEPVLTTIKGGLL